MKNQIKLKLTAITPIHIGTGEDYEPTNFVVEGNYLYEFDEVKFYEKLPPQKQQEFLELIDKDNSLFDIHSFIKKNRELAIKSAISKVQITKGLQNEYEKKVGNVVQKEGSFRKKQNSVFNRFQIAKTSRLANSKKVYIPASSIKGSISTACQSAVYKNNYRDLDYLFYDNQNSIFKNLSIADTTPIKTYSIVGYALNKERFEEDDTGPSNRLETIYKGSEFETTILFKDFQTKKKIDIEFIKNRCNQHYYELFKSMMSPDNIFKGRVVEDYINEYFSDEFYDKYKDFQLKDNQFLIRIGKHSGARAVTIEGKREIRVKISGGGARRKPNRWETIEQETTTWLFGTNENSIESLLPFGWVLCEVV
jgi:CRISPR-associated protein Csm5